jgi:spore maturation protein CgeB
VRVMLIGPDEFWHITAFFRKALEQLGHDHLVIDTERYTRKGVLIQKIAYRLLNKRPLAYWFFNRDVVTVAARSRPDMVLVMGRAFVSPESLKHIKRSGAFLINYATDDPFSPMHRALHLIQGIPLYDLYVCTKRAIMDDVRRAGCLNVSYVPFGYEPSLHFPERPATDEEARLFASDVVFIGGGDNDRLPMMQMIAKRAKKRWTFCLYGGFWNRNWRMRKYYRGFAHGREYRLAVSSAKINLGLVRRANRDGHAMRTFEIPACGAFMLAERTEEHLELFSENKEAAYFGPDEELLEKIDYYLVHDAERQRIAQAGYERVTSGKHTYRNRLQEILELAQELL